MAGQSVGQIYVELDLDFSKFEKNQQKILQSATTTSLSVEKNWQNLGAKSDAIFTASRNSIINSYEMIKNKAGTSAAEIVRAEEAKNAKLSQLNEQQFGHQTSLLDSLKKNWMAVTATAMAVYAAVIKPIEAYMESEKALLKMGMAMKNQGDYTRAGLVDMKEYSEEISRTTAFCEDATLAIMANMKSYGMSNEEVKRATKAALDLTIAKENEGMTVERASEILGKSYLGISTGLKKLGIQVDENAKGSKLFDSVMEQLNQRFGGSAQAELLTYAGQWKQLKNNWEDIQKIAGLVFLKTIESLKTAFFGVSTAFWAVVTGITQGLTWIAKGLEAFQRAIGMEEAANATKTWADSLQWAADSAKGATIEAARLTSTNAQATVSFKNVSDAIDKMGIAGKRTTAVDEDAAKAAKKLADEREKERVKLFQIQQLVKKMGVENVDYSNEATRALSRMSIEENKRIDGLKEQQRIEEIIKKTEGEIAQQMADDMFPAQDKQNRMVQQGNEYWERGNKLASDRLKAYHDLYKDLKGYEGDYYESSKAIILKQAEDYKNLLLDPKKKGTQEYANIEIAIAKRTAEELRKIDEEKVLRSNDFFAGAALGWKKYCDEQLTWTEVSQKIVYDLAKNCEKQLSDNLFNVLTGKFDELGVNWNSLWEGMLRTLTDKLAQMAIEAAAAEIWKLLAPAVGEGLDWFSSIFAAQGIWNVKGATEGIPIIAHPGEMIVPADIAGSIREAGDGGREFDALRDPMKTGKISPTEEAFLVGTARAHGLLGLQSISLALAGKITPEQLMGIFSPQAVISSVLTGGIPSATASRFGLDSKTKYGYTAATMALAALGVPGLLGIGGGLAGMVLTEAIMDMLNVRENEAIKDFLEDKAGWIGSHLDIGRAGSASKALHDYAQKVGFYPTSGGLGEFLYGGPMAPESYATGYGAAGEGSGVDRSGYEWGGSEQGFRYGGVSRGPESGYWAKLHGTELITPLKSGNDPVGGETLIINFYTEGSIIGNQQAFDEFIEKIDYAISKKAKRVYSA